MTRPIPDYLRLHTEAAPLPLPPAAELVPGINDLCRSFEQATGWPLRFSNEMASQPDRDILWETPLGIDPLAPIGRLCIDISRGPLVSAGCDIDAAAGLATSVAGLIQSLLSAQRLVWDREADLAAGVPIVPHPQGRQRLPEVLESLLESAAETVGCQAAGLYMLDDATTELKLRAAWHLPPERVAAPPRLLRESGADLEALTGHAVALEDSSSTIHWKPPEDCRSAICLPVASTTTVLGTMWLYGAAVQSFSDEAINLAEIVAGRIAAELEREMLASEIHQVKDLRRELDQAQESQFEALPSITPLCDGWDVHGATTADQGLAVSFHDWFSVGGGDHLAITLGEIESLGLSAALQSGNLRTSFRAQGDYTHDPIRMMAGANRAMWSGNPAGQPASAFCGIIEPGSRVLRYASSGPLGLLHVQREGVDLLLPQPASLGADPDTKFSEWLLPLSPEELLLVGSETWRRLFEEHGVEAVAQMWRDTLRELRGAAPATLFRSFQRRFGPIMPPQGFSSHSLVMIGRR